MRPDRRRGAASAVSGVSVERAASRGRRACGIRIGGRGDRHRPRDDVGRDEPAPRMRGGEHADAGRGIPAAVEPDDVGRVGEALPEDELGVAPRLDRAGADASRHPPSLRSPQVATALQDNLRLIDQAIAESRRALDADPQSAAARASLIDALRYKVFMLKTTVELMNEMPRGNRDGAARGAPSNGRKS